MKSAYDSNYGMSGNDGGADPFSEVTFRADRPDLLAASRLRKDEDVRASSNSEHLPDIGSARAVLTRTARAAQEALQQLEKVEWQLEQKWKALASLTTEVRKLEQERAAALDLAQKLGRNEMAVPDPLPTTPSHR